MIRARDIKAATKPAPEELDRDFFETRFARATKAGRRYLAAMQADSEVQEISRSSTF